LLQHICRCALRSLCPSPDPSGLAFEEAFGAWAAERISGESLEERPVLFTGVPLDAPENRGASYALLWFLRDTAREDVVATMWRHTGRGVVDALRQARVPLNHLLIQFLKWALNEDLLTSVQFPRDIELERRRLAHCAFWLGPAPDISGILRLNSPYQENAAALLVGTPQAPDFRLRFTPLPTGSPPWQPQHLLVFNSMPGNASIPGALTGIQWSVRCEAIEVSSAAVR
jgi:hypothetical protein